MLNYIATDPVVQIFLVIGLTVAFVVVWLTRFYMKSTAQEHKEKLEWVRENQTTHAVSPL